MFEKKNLYLFDTGIASAKENMSFDEKLLTDLDPQGLPILHFYQWARPAATYGYFIAPRKHLDLEQAKYCGIELARRPTGGGIVFHIWDLAFSFLMPAKHPAFSLNTLENYRFVNQVVLDAVAALFPLPYKLTPETAKAKTPACQSFCMAGPTQYDVLHEGKKIAGAAQRRRKQGYLHQGTISLALPHLGLLERVLRSKGEVLEAMLESTFAPLGLSFEPDALHSARHELQNSLQQKFIEKLTLFQ